MLRTRPETLIERLDEAVGIMRAASADLLEAIPEANKERLWRRDGATGAPR